MIYINTDGNDRGYLGMEGSHSLEHFMNDVARDVEDPESSCRMQRSIDYGLPSAKYDEDRRSCARGRSANGSAWIGFATIRRLSITLGLRRSIWLRGEDDGGIYHSIYDDFYYFTHFSDTDFVYGGRSLRLSEQPCCEWPMPIYCLTSLPISRTP